MLFRLKIWFIFSILNFILLFQSNLRTYTKLFPYAKCNNTILLISLSFIIISVAINNNNLSFAQNFEDSDSEDSDSEDSDSEDSDSEDSDSEDSDSEDSDSEDSDSEIYEKLNQLIGDEENNNQLSQVDPQISQVNPQISQVDPQLPQSINHM